jgi:hypothetical protein
VYHLIFILREEHKPRVFKNRVLRIKFGPKKEEERNAEEVA